MLQKQEDNEHMAYWLSNTSTLLFLIQKSLKPAGATPSRKQQAPTSLFGRMTMVFNCYIFSLLIEVGVSASWMHRVGLDELFVYQFVLITIIGNVFSGIPLITIFCQHWSGSCCTGSSPSWSQVPSSTFQAATYRICWENLRNYSRQLEKGVGITASFVYTGATKHIPLFYLMHIWIIYREFLTS